MIYLVGDVHGEFKLLIANLTRARISNSFIIQVGDFGIGFRSRNEEELELKTINRFLNATNNQLLVVRGNHDDPAYFKGQTRIGNIVFLKDNSLLEIEEKKILLIGGAVSVDRTSRVNGLDYWPEEAFQFNQEILDNVLQQIDKLEIIVTHNAPTEFWPFQYDNIVMSYGKKDKSLLEDLAKERAAHSNLMMYLFGKGLHPKFWYYGHFHQSYKERYMNVKYRLLDCLEIWQHL